MQKKKKTGKNNRMGKARDFKKIRHQRNILFKDRYKEETEFCE